MHNSFKTNAQAHRPQVPVVWSIAGTDSGGGAGLSADQRAVEAFGLHFCPVPAAITAQNSLAVTEVHAVGVQMLRAQLHALAHDMPPRAIKTGMLGTAAQVHEVAETIDRLRRQAPVALVIDPVLRASTGAALADQALLKAMRDELLPRAQAITPNRYEAAALLGWRDDQARSVPEMARALQGLGAQQVVITGGDSGGVLACDWLQTTHAQGWLSLPRVATPHHHGTGCTFASAMAAAMALGWVAADAAVLAKMLTTHALQRARAVGQGAGPVRAAAGFGTDPRLMPRLSLDERLPPTWDERPRTQAPPSGVYAIVDSADRVARCVAAGAGMVQLRIKRPPPDSAGLADEIRHALGHADQAQVVINDHWRLALSLGARALHLGQEDLLALTAQDHAALAHARAQGVQLGLSSHSLWEVCRAASLQPDLIACGPVWATETKAMPWRPQGLDNLAWWVHMAGVPVVAIGGILDVQRLAATAQAGAAAGCVVRGLGSDPAQSLRELHEAWSAAQSVERLACPVLPHPTLADDSNRSISAKP